MYKGVESFIKEGFTQRALILLHYSLETTLILLQKLLETTLILLQKVRKFAFASVLITADHPYAIPMYAGTFNIEKAATPNKKPYLLMNLPYYAGTSLPQYIEWFVQQSDY